MSAKKKSRTREESKGRTPRAKKGKETEPLRKAHSWNNNEYIIMALDTYGKVKISDNEKIAEEGSKVLLSNLRVVVLNEHELPLIYVKIDEIEEFQRTKTVDDYRPI